MLCQRHPKACLGTASRLRRSKDDILNWGIPVYPSLSGKTTLWLYVEYFSQIGGVFPKSPYNVVGIIYWVKLVKNIIFFCTITLVGYAFQSSMGRRLWCNVPNNPNRHEIHPIFKQFARLWEQNSLMLKTGNLVIQCSANNYAQYPGSSYSWKTSEQRRPPSWTSPRKCIFSNTKEGKMPFCPPSRCN